MLPRVNILRHEIFQVVILQIRLFRVVVTRRRVKIEISHEERSRVLRQQFCGYNQL